MLVVILFCLALAIVTCSPVGVADTSKIPDAKMTSSSYNSNYHPYLGRLHETRRYGVWCAETASDRTDFLQVDMGVVHVICAVATQGPGSQRGSHVTSYKLFFSTDGAKFNAYSEQHQAKVKKKRK